jgi:hypothetical protein
MVTLEMPHSYGRLLENAMLRHFLLFHPMAWFGNKVFCTASTSVTCRWHVRLDVSKVRSVANSSQKSVLIADPKPLLT